MPRSCSLRPLLPVLCLLLLAATSRGEEPAALPQAFINGEGPGWRELWEEDFVNVNGDETTWTFADGLIQCTGQPIGVMRTTTEFTNFELVVQWRHLKSGGNSGVFLWAPEKALTDLKPGTLPPGGIEVQVLDHGYAEQYEQNTGKKPEWFTTNGDVFPVGTSTMTPFEPASPNGQRSFPQEPEQGGQRMESLLHPRDQR